VLCSWTVCLEKPKTLYVIILFLTKYCNLEL
jgi:hypothetical protein